MTANLPARPDYFLEDAAINRAGAASLAELPELAPVSPADFKTRIEKGHAALDVRPTETFAAGMFPAPSTLRCPASSHRGLAPCLGYPPARSSLRSRATRSRKRACGWHASAWRPGIFGGLEGWRRAGFVA